MRKIAMNKRFIRVVAYTQKDGNTPDCSIVLDGYSVEEFEHVNLLALEVAWSQPLPDVFVKARSLLQQDHESRPHAVLVIKLLNYTKPMERRKPPGLVALWFSRYHSGTNNDDIAVLHYACFGYVPLKDIEYLRDNHGVNVQQFSQDVVFQGENFCDFGNDGGGGQINPTWTINVKNELFGFVTRDAYLRVARKYLTAYNNARDSGNTDDCAFFESVLNTLKGINGSTDNSLSLDVGAIWRFYKNLYEYPEEERNNNGNNDSDTVLENYQTKSDSDL